MRRLGGWLHYQGFLYYVCRGWSRHPVQALWKLLGMKLGYLQAHDRAQWRWGPRAPRLD